MEANEHEAYVKWVKDWAFILNMATIARLVNMDGPSFRKCLKGEREFDEKQLKAIKELVKCVKRYGDN